MSSLQICTICGKYFSPNKYHPRQRVCSDLSCQKKRQLINQKEWRQKNPSYFKYKERKTFWEKKRAKYLQIWRQNHKDYFKRYRLAKKQKFDLNLDK